MASTLTKEDAFKFLEDILNIQNPQSQWTQKSKLQFLTLITSNWQQNLPFQNIYQIQLVHHEDCAPTIQEIIQHQMEGRGGVCIQHTVFCHHLLSTLDYQVDFMVASIETHLDHCTILVRNVETPGDSYIVEVATGWPTFFPIPLDDLTADLKTSKIYYQSYFAYSYVRAGDSVTRYHWEDYSVTADPARIEGWVRRIHYDVTLVVSLDYFLSEESHFAKLLRDVGGLQCSWLKSHYAMFYPEGHMIAIKSDDLIVDENKKRVKKMGFSKLELIGLYKQYFPMLDLGVVNEVLDLTQGQVDEVDDI